MRSQDFIRVCDSVIVAPPNDESIAVFLIVLMLIWTVSCCALTDDN